MNIEQLAEPELQFGAGRHVDIRFGIKNYGPFNFNDALAPKQIKIGLVGTNSTIQGLKDWLNCCKTGIPAKESKKPNLFPPFPGFGADSCFRCELVLNDKLERAINQRDIQKIVGAGNRELGVAKAAELFFEELQYLSENSVADVFVCAPPIELFQFFAKEGGREADEEPTDSSPKIRHDFHDMLKATSLRLKKPIQMIRPSTYDESIKDVRKKGTVRGLQDAATRAWNFHTALYYKASGTPWRLVKNPSELTSCYIGVSFYQSLDRTRLLTSVAQVFNERGEGIILRGGTAEMSKDDLQPHLSEQDMKALVSGVLSLYRKEHKTLPARVVVHKTSSYSDGEKRGCELALQDQQIDTYDLLIISDSFTRLFRDGQYPPLRGSFFSLDAKHHILYTRGSIDFYMLYPGMYVPKPLHFTCVDNAQTPRALAQEILALTKMNWNNTQFDCASPITIHAARQVGAILKYVGDNDPIQGNYAFYM